MKQSKILLALTGALVLCGAAGWGATWAQARAVPAPQITQSAEAAEGPADLPPEPVSYDPYAPFGLTYDALEDVLYYEGEPVRYFFDGVALEDGGSIARCEFLNRAGTVDVHTVRTVMDNGDGSVNLFGDLVGLARYTQAEFDRRDLSAPKTECATCEGEEDPDAPSFAQRFEPYAPFGLQYVEGEGSGCGSLYYHGQPVRALVDQTPGGGAFSFISRGGGDFSLRTVYDDAGNLCGLAQMDESDA